MGFDSGFDFSLDPADLIGRCIAFCLQRPFLFTGGLTPVTRG
jgi:hypothetical protein